MYLYRYLPYNIYSSFQVSKRPSIFPIRRPRNRAFERWVARIMIMNWKYESSVLAIVVDELPGFLRAQKSAGIKKKATQKTHVQFQNRYLPSTVALLSLCVSRAFFTTSLWQMSDAIANSEKRATAISLVSPRPLPCTLC